MAIILQEIDNLLFFNQRKREIIFHERMCWSPGPISGTASIRRGHATDRAIAVYRNGNIICAIGLLAHLSRRRPSVVVGRPQCSNIFFSETAYPIKAKFYVEPSWVAWKACSRHLGHMTKMAATPIYGKKPSKIFFSRTGRLIFTKLGM